MLNKNLRLNTPLLLCLLLSLPAGADDMAAAAEAMCENIKTCSMAEIAESGMTPEMRQMMEPMLENMCASMRGQMGEIPSGNANYDSAVACMRSMAALSCEDIKDTNKVVTPECEVYEDMASMP
jgi:hypothetical protein